MIQDNVKPTDFAHEHGIVHRDIKTYNLMIDSRHARRDEMAQHVRQVLARMKPNDREILVLRHLEELSPREIAGVLGISEMAVKKHQVRALFRLREFFNDQTGWQS